MKQYIFLLILEEPCSKFNYLLQTNEYIRKALAGRRETETMLSACLNQKISWSNEEKEKEYKQMLDSSKENVVHWRFI